MDPLDFLQALIAIPSPTGQEDALAHYLVAQLSTHGFRARIDQAGNVVGKVGQPDAERVILLLGHIDTVPGSIPIRLDGGRLFGRGAVDAKGALAAFVLAAEHVAPRLTGTQVWVVGAVEEEGHAWGARHLARTMQCPDQVIIGEPSDWQAITLGYKGSLTVDYHLRQPAGHSAGQRKPPAEEAVAFWNRLLAYARELNGGEFGRFHTLDPTLRDIRTSTDGLYDWLHMNINMRLPPGLEPSGLKEELESWSGAELKFHPSYPPVQSEKNTPVVRAMLRAIRAEGGRPRFKLKTGTADMNVVGPVWGCPIVAYGPGDSTLDHTPEEHIVVDEYLRSIKVLIRTLETLGA